MSLAGADSCFISLGDLIGRIFSPRSLNALQYRQAKENQRPYYNPVRGNVEDHRTIDQPTDQDQKAGDVNPE